MSSRPTVLQRAKRRDNATQAALQIPLAHNVLAFPMPLHPQVLAMPVSKSIPQTSESRSRLRWAALALAVAVTVAGCGGDTPAPDAAPADPAQAPAVEQAAVVDAAATAKVAGMSVDALREAATTAQREQRMYAPAGDNAMEYYLALRDKQPNDAAVSSALTDLMPYATIHAEQSIGRDDFEEAKRVLALMQRADPSAPALPRLRNAISEGETSLAQRQEQQQLDAAAEAERQAKLEEDRKKQLEENQRRAAQELAQQQAAQQAAAEQNRREQEQRQAAEREAAERRAAEQRTAEQRAAQQRAAAAAPSANDLRAISTPAPRYPPEALRAGTSGEVVVEFTVNVDGSVGDARVVRGNPPRVFDREAVNAVKRWRFQPVAAPVTTRRTIGFNPAG